MTDPSEIPDIIDPLERAGAIAALEQHLGGLNWDELRRKLNAELKMNVEPGSPAEMEILISVIDALIEEELAA